MRTAIVLAALAFAAECGINSREAEEATADKPRPAEKRPPTVATFEKSCRGLWLEQASPVFPDPSNALAELVEIAQVAFDHGEVCEFPGRDGPQLSVHPA